MAPESVETKGAYVDPEDRNPVTAIAPPTTLWGNIDKNGTVTNGSTIVIEGRSSAAFTTEKTSTGTYLIKFDDHLSFLGPPAVIAQQLHDGNLKDGCLTAGYLVDDTVTKTPNSNSIVTGVRIITGEEDGDRSSRAFSFVITGHLR